MDTYRLGHAVGLGFGLLIGLVIALLLVRYMNTNHRVKTEYDEMQKNIRNQGYMYAFYTVIILEAVLCFVGTAVDIPAEPIVIHFLPIFLGVVVQACYCIWKHAYIGLNTNLKRYLIIAVVASVINLLSFFMAWKSGSLFTEHVMQAPFVNLLCAVMFLIIGAAALLRKATDREVEE